VCYEPDDDELMDAMFLELQIGIGNATGAPMLLDNDFSRLGLKPRAKFAAPRAVFESLVHPGCFLNRRNIFPRLVFARPISTMEWIEDTQLCSEIKSL
jgi:hypothetical protein